MDLATLIKVGTKIVGGVKTVNTFFKDNPQIGTAASFFANKSQTDSSYQRQMRDMRKAGLNPLLAGKMGGAQSAVMGDLGQVSNTARSLDQNQQLINANIDKINKDIESLEETIHGQKNENFIKDQIVEMHEKYPQLAFWNNVLKGSTVNDYASALTYEKALEAVQQIKDEMSESIPNSRKRQRNRYKKQDSKQLNTTAKPRSHQ
jgi:uncharacterized membrane protein YheB (UPF0754 family)